MSYEGTRPRRQALPLLTVPPPFFLFIPPFNPLQFVQMKSYCEPDEVSVCYIFYEKAKKISCKNIMKRKIN